MFFSKLRIMFKQIRVILINLLVTVIFLSIVIIILNFLNIKYSGNPIYNRLGIELDQLKYFKKKSYNRIEKDYQNFFSNYETGEYLNFYIKENKSSDLYSANGVDINLVYFRDKNNCRENQPEDYFETDIVLLGDSYLWGVSINKPFDITGRLRTYFPKKKILNLGTPGSGPVDQFVRLNNITNSINFSNFVWFFFEGNDYQESTIMDGSHLENKCGSIGNKINPALYPAPNEFQLKDILLKKYGLDIKIKIFISEFLRGLNSFLKYILNYNNKYYDNKYNLNEEDYNLTLQKAKKYLDLKNVNRRIIYYIPSYSYQSYTKNTKHPQIQKMRILKNKVKEIALKNNFEFLDGNIFLDKVKNRSTLYHYGYPTHFNSTGYHLIAKQVYESLNKN